MNIEELFEEYESTTVAILETIKREEYEKLEFYFSKRQSVLENFNKLAYSKEELNELYLKHNIDELEKTLKEDIKNRKEELLNKIKESQKRRAVMNGYNNLQARAVFLSREL